MSLTMDDKTLGSSFQLSVDYCPDRTNYLTLPSPDTFNAAEVLNLHPELKYFIFRISWSEVPTGETESVTRHVYIPWRGRYTYDNNKVVSLPTHVAQGLEIPRGMMVTLQLVIPQPAATFVSLRPMTEQDYVIAETNDEFITSHLLQQVNLINMHRLLKVWIRGSLVTFRPYLEGASGDSAPTPITTPSYALLAPNTLVEISTVRDPTTVNTSSPADLAAVAEKDEQKARKLLTLQQPKFPNVLVRVVPLPPLTTQLQHQELLSLKKVKKSVKAQQQVKDAAPGAGTDKPNTSNVNNIVVTQTYEEPAESANIIHVSQDLYDMLGYNKAITPSSTTTDDNNVDQQPILPIIVLRTDRYAKPSHNLIHKNVHEAAAMSPTEQQAVMKKFKSNYDAREEYHMPYPTPLEAYFNNTILISKIKVHPALKGMVIALHSVQRNATLLPAHCQIYASPYHPYLGEMVTNTSMLKYLGGASNFTRMMYGAAGMLTRNVDPVDLSKEDQSILRLTYVPPSDAYKAWYKKNYYQPLLDKYIKNNKTGFLPPPPPPRTLISLERVNQTSMDYRTMARPTLRIRQIQFNLKDQIEHLDPLQIPRSWIELSFYMYLSNLQKNATKAGNNNKSKKNSTNDNNNNPDNHLIFGPNTAISIPLYVNHQTVESEEEELSHGSGWLRGASYNSSRDSSLFTYQQISPYCFRQIPCLQKSRPQGGYNGQYPHYNQPRNQPLLAQQESDYDDEEEDSDEYDESEDEAAEEERKKEEQKAAEKVKIPKTSYPVEDLFWYSGAYISLMVVPTLNDNRQPANFVTVQIHRLEHTPYVDEQDDEFNPLLSLAATTVTPPEAASEDAKKDAAEAAATAAALEISTPGANALTQQQQEKKKVIYPLTTVCLTTTPLDEHPILSAQSTPLYTVRKDKVTPLPSVFKYDNRGPNKYMLQEEDSDIDDLLLQDDATLAEKSKAASSQDDMENFKKFKTKKLSGEDDEDEDDYDEDDDEDYEDEDEDEEEETLTPMQRLMGKKAGADNDEKAKQVKAKNRAESRKHNHSNIREDDSDWDDEDRAEEMAYFSEFAKQYRKKQDNGDDDDDYEDDIEKVFIYTQRYKMNTPTGISIFKPIIIPQLTMDTWQTFCPPSAADDNAEKSKVISSAPDGKKNAAGEGGEEKKEGGGVATAAAKMMAGQQPGGGEEEEEEEDPAVTQFIIDHIRLLQQQEYMLQQQHIDLIYEHLGATTDHLDASLSLGFPISKQVLYPTIQNPSVLHIPTSPLSGKAYIEALPSTTLTNGDFTKANPICIASPISTHMYNYLASYPFSTNVIQWFDSIMTSLSLLQPHFNHLNSLMPENARQLQSALNQHVTVPATKDGSKKRTYALGYTESQMVIPTITNPQQEMRNITIKEANKIIAMNQKKNKKNDDKQQQQITTTTTTSPPQQILSGMLTNVISHGILYGSNKSGKTTTVCYLAHMLSQHPSVNAHVIYVDCAPYEHASVQIVGIVFKHIFLSSRLKHRPCVIVLDNLDKIAFPHKEHEDNSLAEAIIELLIEMHNQQLNDRTLYPTILLATAKHAEAIHPKVSSALFAQYSCTIEPPTYIQRQFIINDQLNSFATAFSSRTTKQSKKDKELRQLDAEVLQTIINATEGYTFPDITLLVHKIVNYMTVEQQKKLQQRIQQLKLYYKTKLLKLKEKKLKKKNKTDGDVDNVSDNNTKAITTTTTQNNNIDPAEKALEEEIQNKESNKEKELMNYKSRWGLKDINSDLITRLTSSYVPLPLRGIGLSKPTSAADQRKWWDVGALNNVIQTLRQTFEYPVLYPQLFNNSPLKLISGALLYGAPGSAKSLLASALQYSCPKLHFIRVKGPEVLDKYVGASEENVRKIFASARAAKPCVIFFDDFDSIALKRGSDSNGVTDRVVNQLLIEMDGVKGRSGVFVLAATTSPQLIDSALLRPGRLDLQLYCPLPETIADREAVLRAVAGCNLDYKPKDNEEEEKEVEKKKDVAVVVPDVVTTTTTTSTPAPIVETAVDPESSTNNTDTPAVEKKEGEEEQQTATPEEATKPNNNNKKPVKKQVKTVAPPIQGAKEYVFNTVSYVKKQYQTALDHHNTIHGHTHSLDTPQGRTIALRKYKHRYPYVMADDADFTKIAKMTKSFTGADMNALMTNAMIIATQQDDDEEEEEDGETKKEKEEEKKEKLQVEFLYGLPIITTEILIQAYDMTPLSLPVSDRSKFTEAFKKFISDKDQADGGAKFDPKKANRVAMAQ